MLISTRNLSALPTPERLEALCRTLALLEAILSPNWQYRYFHFDAFWSPENGDRMAKMDNGSGDEYFIAFGPQGVFIKGFAHESDFTPYAQDPMMVWPGVLESVPPVFNRFLTEPAFSIQETTFCIWREKVDMEWKTGTIAYSDMPDPDGSEDLLWMLDDNPTTYQSFCNEYYQKVVPGEAVAALYAGEPLTPQLMMILNAEAIWADVVKEAQALAYPTE